MSDESRKSTLTVILTIVRYVATLLLGYFGGNAVQSFV